MTEPEFIEPNFGSVPKPAHVAAELVVDFDYLHPEGIESGDVYRVLKRLHDGPDIQWTPRNGGHWIVTRAEDIRWVQLTHTLFSRTESFIPRGSVKAVLPPLTVDPPMHTRFRAVLNPFFRPAKVAELRDKVRTVTRELAAKMRPNGGCEFVTEFAQIMPVVMFLGIVDLPVERREEFHEQASGFIHATDAESRDRHLKSVSRYLKGVLDERYANPGDDLLSAIAAWRDNPRFGGDHEMLGMALVVFFGGLDTVANMLSFTARHLAGHPEHRRQIRENPEIIPRAVEEFIRRFGLSSTGRLIRDDVERKGARMKKDEMIWVATGLASLDERKYPDPFKLDFDRPENFERDRPAHDTFGNGPHKCVGAPLARAELEIFLEEWLRLIPDFRLDPAQPVVTHLGGVSGIDRLHLLWDI
jgi:cytochrome P450